VNTVNKIVVLDSLGVDTSVFESLAKECIVYDITAPQQVVERASGADAVFTNKTLISSGDIDTLSRGSLRYIGVLATGYNVVDVEAARRNGVAVTNVPAYSTNSVAQLTIALLLELTHHTGHHAQTVREGRWSRSTAFSTHARHNRVRRYREGGRPNRICAWHEDHRSSQTAQL